MGQTMTTSQAGDDREPWQRAYAAIFALGITSGFRFATRWLYQVMEVPRVPARIPGESDLSYGDRCQKHRLQAFEPERAKLAQALLDRHGMWMRACGGSTGPSEYELRNADGAELLMRETTRSVSKAIGRATKTLAGMSTDGLTDTQKAGHADAQAKAAYLESMMKKRPR